MQLVIRPYVKAPVSLCNTVPFCRLEMNRGLDGIIFALYVISCVNVGRHNPTERVVNDIIQNAAQNQREPLVRTVQLTCANCTPV